LPSRIIRQRRRIFSAGAGVFLLGIGLVCPACALGPHEILVLANTNSPRSMELARDYAALRHVPAVNLVALDLPNTPPLDISPADFNKTIRDPARKAIKERGLDDHILAWVYSVDFPIRATSTPPLSLQGITFMRGEVPASDIITRGAYASPLFAGPATPGMSGFPSQSLDVQREWIGPAIPVPSMMLGFMGTNGNTREEIWSCLNTGVASDGTAPQGTVYIVTNTDVRTLCRAWQFAPVVRELGTLDLTATLTNGYPASGIAGLMSGAADIPMPPAGPPSPFLPGAFAEHLTSFGAAFDYPGQTKITSWIRAGATASSGSVAEPLSVWGKFPHARIFSHQASGCTLLESVFQSVRCPLQLLVIGEPLARPWAPASTLSLQGLESGVLDKRITVTAVLHSRRNEVFPRYLFLLDGRTHRNLTKSPETVLDPVTLPRGRHVLVVVAYRTGSVRSQVFAEMPFEVK